MSTPGRLSGLSNREGTDELTVRTRYTWLAHFFGVFVLCVALHTTTFAQTIPGPADAGRIDIRPETLLPPRETPGIVVPPTSDPEAAAPEEASSLSFTLQDVVIEGMTAFSHADMEDIYRSFVGKDIPLSRLWEFAGQITGRYRSKNFSGLCS
ncbi:MAG: hypothetical protein EOM26_08000 [Alphaproteobacteria bacterium]|nr:hypothetical protein [Alphaproteobacteria bacterium]